MADLGDVKIVELGPRQFAVVYEKSGLEVRRYKTRHMAERYTRDWNGASFLVPDAEQPARN